MKMTDKTLTLDQCVNVKGTIRDIQQLAVMYLAQEGVEEAKENGELLLLYVLEIDRGQLLMKWNDPFPPSKHVRWKELLDRKAKGEPIQYIIGEAWFYSRPFVVNPSVLIPRPETELLVEAVLKEMASIWRKEEVSPVVLDVGTGSGAIAVTLQAENPGLTVIASDISSEALDTARQNAKSQKIEQQIAFVQGDLLTPFILKNELMYEGKHIDVLVSNPPYIPHRDMKDLQREVRDYEPHLALVGGEDGLDPYRAMLQTIEGLEHKPFIVAFELGIHQPAQIAEYMEKMNFWSEVKIITDYNGIDRHIIAIKR